MCCMDRRTLALYLGQGLSLEQIGKRVGRDPSTVGYWLKKHGLAAVHRGRHRPRAGIPRPKLELLVQRGLSHDAMAAELGVSTSTVRFWLRKYGLRTQRSIRRSQAREQKAAGQSVARLVCRHHGLTDFVLQNRGYYRCMRCRSDAVARRRMRVKAILVRDAGGKCRLCGYERHIGALQFHHVDPSQKVFAVSRDGVTRSLARAREEAKKCVLLCGNCHAEVEAGLSRL